MRNEHLVERRLQSRLKRYTQSEIARAVGISAQTVCDVVKGRCKPGEKLVRWLGFEVGYLPIRKEPQPEAQSIDQAA